MLFRSANDGQLHGSGHVSRIRTQEYQREGETFSLVLFKPIRTFPRVGHGVGQQLTHILARTIFGVFATKSTENRSFRCFLELLGRFELPTSSLPTTVEPSSPCCSRLFGGFLSKKDEVATCLFHCFRPLISPCGSRCGSNHFQDANEGRTSDSGKPSRCALSRS